MRKKIEVPKSDVILMYNTFSEVKEKFTKELTYAISYTKRSIQNEATALLDAMTPSDSYVKYETQRNEIVTKYAKKNDDGSTMTSMNGAGVIIEPINLPKVKTELDALNTEYADIIKQRDEDVKSFKNILNETIEIEVETVSWGSIPSEGISDVLMDALIPIITKEED